MKIGFINDPKDNIFSEIEWAKKYKFDFMDLTYEPPNDYWENRIKIKKEILRAGLALVGHTNPTLPAIYPVKSIKEASFSEMEKAFEFFNYLGIKSVSIHAFSYSILLDDEERFLANVDFISRCDKLCRSLGMELMLENSFAPYNDPQTFKRIIEKIPTLKILLDMGHCNIANEETLKTVEEFFKTFTSRIIHVHFHDNHGNHDDHLPLGCGQIDWEGVVEILKRYKYDGFITLEVFCKDADYIVFSREKIKRLWALQ